MRGSGAHLKILQSNFTPNAARNDKQAQTIAAGSAANSQRHIYQQSFARKTYAFATVAPTAVVAEKCIFKWGLWHSSQTAKCART